MNLEIFFNNDSCRILYYALIINAFLCAFFSCWLADTKGRRLGTWFLLGLFFGEIALLSIGFSPSLIIEDKINKIFREIERQRKN